MKKGGGKEEKHQIKPIKKEKEAYKCCSEAAYAVLSRRKTHVDIKGALKFMQPVNKQNGLLPNRRLWRSFLGGIIRCFIFIPVVKPCFLPSFLLFCFLQRLHRVLPTLRLDVCSLFEVQPAGNGAWRSLSLEEKTEQVTVVGDGHAVLSSEHRLSRVNRTAYYKKEKKTEKQATNQTLTVGFRKWFVCCCLSDLCCSSQAKATRSCWVTHCAHLFIQPLCFHNSASFI